MACMMMIASSAFSRLTCAIITSISSFLLSSLMALKVDMEENFTLQHTYLRDKIWDIYVKLGASLNVKFGICRHSSFQ
jgi:hypothetical protein